MSENGLHLYHRVVTETVVGTLSHHWTRRAAQKHADRANEGVATVRYVVRPARVGWKVVALQCVLHPVQR